MNWSTISQFVDANKLGGWVRAGVASILAVAIGKWPLLGAILDPATQQALGVVLAGVVVGFWSQLTKTDSQKMKMVEAIPDVKQIVVAANATDGVANAAEDTSRPKVVTTQ